MAKEKGPHRWFVEPLDDGGATNEALSKAQPSLSPEGMLEGVLGDKGERHNLWQVVGYCDITRLREMQRNDARIQFRVWHQEGNGPIRIWSFSTRKR